MRENKAKRLLREGAVTIGTWVTLDGPLAAEILAARGFDWLVIDMEHGPVSMDAAQGMMAAIRTTETVPLVRVGWNRTELIHQALDIGAYGLVIPMVNSLTEARQAVKDARYAPLGDRSRGGARAPLAFATDAVTYGRRANDETLLIVQIETAEAVAAAEEMAALDGLDGLFVGPNDLSSSLDVWPPVWDNQPAAFAEAIARIPVVAHAHGKAAGIMVPDATIANRCIAQGYDFISLSNDASLLERVARAELAAIAGRRQS